MPPPAVPKTRVRQVVAPAVQVTQDITPVRGYNHRQIVVDPKDANTDAVEIPMELVTGRPPGSAG